MPLGLPYCIHIALPMSRVKVHFQNTFNGDNEKECAACRRQMHLRDLNMFYVVQKFIGSTIISHPVRSGHLKQNVVPMECLYSHQLAC